jgi:hypothetical protein
MLPARRRVDAHIGLRELKLINIRSKPAIAPAIMKYYTAIYDNSSAFSRYLMKHDTADAARKAGVKLKSKHTIVPHVSLTPSCYVLDAESVLAHLCSLGCAIECTS